MKIAIGTTNKTKIEAVEAATSIVFPNNAVEFRHGKAPSGVPD